MILTTIALVAQASPMATASAASVTIPDDAKVDATAKAWFVSMQHGKVLDKSALTSDMVALLTPTILTGFEAKIGPLGAPTAFKLSKSGAQGATTSPQAGRRAKRARSPCFTSPRVRGEVGSR